MRFCELDGKTIGLWGLGVETRSFVEQSRKRLPRAQLAVLVLDEPSAASLEGVRVVGPGEAVGALRDCDVLVRSPGVSIHRPQLRTLAGLGVPSITPTGLWLAQRGGRRVIGVTGTKGKSTTATVIAQLAAAAGHEIELAGNIGRPALELLDAPDERWAVIELSSYQTADLTSAAEVMVVTNLYREHTDWHGSEATYRSDKLRALALPGVVVCVLPAGEPPIHGTPRGGVRVVRFGVREGWHVQPDGIADGDALRIPAAALPLRGEHNALNVCAALAALEAAGLALPALPGGLDGLHGLPHRLQVVAQSGGVEWVDDSISTTPESTIAAIASFPDQPVILLGGGSDREQDYGELARVAAERRVLLLGLPVTGPRLLGAARDAGLPAERSVEVGDMVEAVAVARRHARPGTVVLMSPAAPSFNAYRDFQARGDHFATLARATAPAATTTTTGTGGTTGSGTTTGTGGTTGSGTTTGTGGTTGSATGTTGTTGTGTGATTGATGTGAGAG